MARNRALIISSTMMANPPRKTITEAITRIRYKLIKLAKARKSRGEVGRISHLQVVLVALRQARPRGADGKGRSGRPFGGSENPPPEKRLPANQTKPMDERRRPNGTGAQIDQRAATAKQRRQQQEHGIQKYLPGF